MSTTVGSVSPASELPIWAHLAFQESREQMSSALTCAGMLAPEEIVITGFSRFGDHCLIDYSFTYSGASYSSSTLVDKW